MKMAPEHGLRVLFVIKELHGAAGGAERVLATITAGLARLGHKVIVASFDQPHDEPFYPFAAAVERIQLGSRRSGARTSVTDIVRRAIALRGLVRRLHPDVVVGFMNSAFVPLALGMIGTGIPVVASEHIGYSHYRDRRAERWLLTLVNRLVARMTVPSASIRETFPSALFPRMVAMANPVDVPAAVPPYGERAMPLVLAAGRLTPQKDFKTLIAAFGQLAGMFPEWRLRIVGEGKLRRSLEHMVVTLGLSDRVELPGVVMDMDREYARAAILVMPSLYESMGLVTAEALARGVPAIGFADCPGTNELIVTGTNGLLVQGDDRVVALAAGMRQLMADPAERTRMAIAAPMTVRHLLGDAVVTEWDRLLNEVVAVRA